MVDVGEHYRPTDENYECGVYRVVGTAGLVTLLRITDADGERIHSGTLRHVSPTTLDAAFESIENPDTGFSPVSDARNALSGLYWSVRKFL